MTKNVVVLLLNILQTLEIKLVSFYVSRMNYYYVLCLSVCHTTSTQNGSVCMSFVRLDDQDR